MMRDAAALDGKRVVKGRVVDLGGGRIMKKNRMLVVAGDAAPYVSL